MPQSNTKIRVYQAKTAIFLAWSQPFIYRLLDQLKPHVDQIVLTRFIENQDLFPMPMIEQCEKQAFFDPLVAQQRAQQLTAKHNAHLIHAHFGYTAINMMLLKVFLRIPMIVTFGGKDLSVFAQRPDSKPVFKQLFDLCEQFVAVSDSLRQQAIDLGCPENKIITIRRGVPINDFPYHTRTHSPDKPCQILMVSRLTKKKGHHFALSALNQIKHLNWQLNIIGEGEELTALNNFANQNNLTHRINYLGVLPNQQVKQHLNQSDIFLHPSITGNDGDQEGIPNALVEAMSTGLLVIATHHGGIPEVITHNQTGLLVNEHDTNNLTHHLQQLIQSPSLRHSLGRAASTYVANHLSLEHQVTQYLHLYQQFANVTPQSNSLRHLSNKLPIQLAAIHNTAIAKGDYSIAEVIENVITRITGRAFISTKCFRLYWQIKNRIPFTFKFTLKRLLFRFLAPFASQNQFLNRSLPFWERLCDDSQPYHHPSPVHQPESNLVSQDA